eukprot:4793497-Pyramimonas_sp.AAC.1
MIAPHSRPARASSATGATFREAPWPNRRRPTRQADPLVGFARWCPRRCAPGSWTTWWVRTRKRWRCGSRT